MRLFFDIIGKFSELTYDSKKPSWQDRTAAERKMAMCVFTDPPHSKKNQGVSSGPS